MKRVLLVSFLATAMALAQTKPASLQGTITDPSGATVPGAVVQIIGPGGTQRAQSNENGKFSFPALTSGTYRVRVISKGFGVLDQPNYPVEGATNFDAQLSIAVESQVMNVEAEVNRVTADPTNNADALVLKERELEALSDDPDELAQQLQALAGPSAGPNGGQIYIDGFTGGNLPSKSSIREVRINSNPYAPEFDRPGFGRIEIFTKPGTDKLRGQAFVQFNDEALNSRSPLLTSSTRPPYQTRFYGISLTGPITPKKASFGFDFERRGIEENAFIYATTLDSNLQPQQVNQAVVTPQSRTTITPRIDLSLNATNTLVGRYQYSKISQDGEGIGNFSLASRGYQNVNSEHTVQLTETAILSPRAINETRFQFMRSRLANNADNSAPSLIVQGAFEGGGAQVGNSGNLYNRLELTNMTTYTRGTHTFKWGGRLRNSGLDDTSVNNFGGTYTFFGGLGPVLDANNLVIPGSSVQLTALERYQRTLYFQGLGYTGAQIRELGGGASQFSLGAGTPTSTVNQIDVGLFANDDWRVRPNLTISYGLRYEAQTNIADLSNFAPRVGVAWGIDGKGTRAAKTVLRAGFGIFFDRISETSTLQAQRFNGTTQQSYLLLNPNFFPLIPDSSLLEQQPQRLQYLDSTVRSPRTCQLSLGVDRQINQYFRLSAQYINIRGVHILRSRNINAPIDGSFPYGDSQLRILNESTGVSRINQFMLSPNISYKKLFLFGFYSMSFGKTNADGAPADPYNLAAEWGPSSFADVRHRFMVGTSIPLYWGVSVSPFITASSGQPYNITTGRDTNGDGYNEERPSVDTAIGQSACTGGSLVYSPVYGCFNLNPAPGTSIGRNYGRGPANFSVNMRLMRTWAFGNRGESGTGDNMPPGMGGIRGGGPGGPGGGGGGPRGGGGGGPMMGGGGPPAGLFGGNSGKRYNLTLSVSARNLFNTANYAPPSGDLSSPYFGEYRSLAGFGPFGGASTYNRKIDLQLRFTF